MASNTFSRPATAASVAAAGAQRQEASGSSLAQRRGQTGKDILLNFLGLGQKHSEALHERAGLVTDADRPNSSTISTKSWAPLADSVAIALESDPSREHTFASEQDGQTFIDFIDCFKQDAADQIDTLRMAIEKISATMVYFQNSAAEQAEALGIFEGPPLCCTAERYVRRMMKYGGCSPCNVIIGLMYLERIQRSTCPILELNPSNAQRLLLTAVMVACKVFDDIYYSNKYWGMIGELSASEMSELELRYIAHRAERRALSTRIASCDAHNLRHKCQTLSPGLIFSNIFKYFQTYGVFWNFQPHHITHIDRDTHTQYYQAAV